MTTKKRLVLLILLLVFLLAALGITLILIRQRQEIRKRAQEGQPTLSLRPNQQQIEIYSGLPLEIVFNTNNLLISKIAVRLTYQYQEEDPQIKFDLSRSSFNSDLLNAGWDCPVMTTSFETGSSPKKGILDLECNHGTGYSNSSDTQLAAVLMRAYNLPEINPIEQTFDSGRSFVIDKNSGQQVSFQILTSGVYEVVTCIGCTPTPEPPTATPTTTPTSPPPPPGATATPTPAGGVGQPDQTPTSTPTPPPGATATPTLPPGTTATPTITGGTGSGSTPTQSGSSGRVPVTAISIPTHLFLTIGGVIFLFGFLLLI